MAIHEGNFQRAVQQGVLAGKLLERLRVDVRRGLLDRFKRRPAVLGGNRPQDLLGDLPASVGVSHHRGAHAKLGIGYKLTPEALVRASMAELLVLSLAINADPEPPFPFLHEEHLAGHLRRQHSIRLSGPGLLNLDRELAQVGGGGPQPSGGHLGVSVPLALDNVTIRTVTARRLRSPSFGERLLVGTVRHTKRGKNRFTHEPGKRFACNVHHQELRDANSATRITPDCARHRVHSHRLSVGRLLSVQHLHNDRYRVAFCVPRKPVDGEACRMTQEPAKRDFLIFSFVVLWHLPGDQPFVYVFVQGQAAELYQMKRTHCRYRLADRCRLKKRSRSCARGLARLDHSVCPRPFDSAVVAHRDADSRYAQRSHAFGERVGVGRSRDLNGGKQTLLNPADSLLNSALVIEAGANRTRERGGGTESGERLKSNKNRAKQANGDSDSETHSFGPCHAPIHAWKPS